MGCLSGIAKYILFLFNMLIQIAAIALIAVGVIYHKENSGLDLLSVSSFTIAVGVIIALISFLGCYGVLTDSRCLLLMYAYILITIFIVQVVLIVLAFLAMRNTDSELNNEVEKYLTKIYEKMSVYNVTDVGAINVLQKEFECCGIDANNYTLVQIESTGRLMDSCCRGKYIGQCTENNAYQSDCVVKLQEFIESNAKIIGGIAIVLALVEIVAAIFAFYVRHNIGRRS